MDHSADATNRIDNVQFCDCSRSVQPLFHTQLATSDTLKRHLYSLDILRRRATQNQLFLQPPTFS